MASNSNPGTEPFAQREIELRRAEQEVGSLEERLVSEATATSESAKSLGPRLEAIRAQAIQFQSAGLRAQPLGGMLQRLEATSVPEHKLGAWRERSLDARVTALKVRAQATQQFQLELAGFKSQVSALAAQLKSDEAALKTFPGQLQEQTKRAEAPPGLRPVAEPAAAKTAVEPARPPPPPTEAVQPRSLGRMTAPGAAIAGRQLRRVKMQTVVDVGSDSNFFQGFSTNLSEGGLFVATVKTVPPGTEIDLHFTLPGGRKIEVRGVVRWYREVNDQSSDVYPGVGVEFVDLPAEAAAAIHDFVATREPMFFAT